MGTLEISKWDYHGDWENAELSIQTVNSDGTFRGSISFHPVRGKFFEPTQEINFVRLGPSDNITNVYSGIMTSLETKTDFPEFFLAGTYEKVESTNSGLARYG
jgi:hypothetical protein